jgi:predicted transcriptional regulator
MGFCVCGNRSNDIDWGKIQVISEPVFTQNLSTKSSEAPRIAVENDKIYVVWEDMNNTNGAGIDKDIFFRYFNGNKWSDIQVISEPIPDLNISKGWETYPDIAVENGRIYVVWGGVDNISGEGTDGDIYFRCNLKGSSWEDIQVISEPVQGQNNNNKSSSRPRIAVDNGKIYVVWMDGNNTNNAGNDNDIFYRCNVTGSNWGDIQVISEPVFGQNINNDRSLSPSIAAENGKIYVVWEDETDYNGAGTLMDIFYRANLTGTGWEDIQVISEPVPGKDFNTYYSSYPDIEVENGKIYAVWEGRNATYGGTWAVTFFRCNLTGTNWESEQMISENVQSRSWRPDISVDNGKLHVIWSDDSNKNGCGGDRDIFHRCNLNGSGWGEYHIISEPIINQNFNTGGTAGRACSVENNVLFVVWSDGNNTDGSGIDNDISLRKLKFTSLPFSLKFPEVSPRSGNTSTEFNFSTTYYHSNNTPPTTMKVIIDGIEHLMLEVDTGDTNYIDGKNYYFKIKNLDIGTHTYEFNASDGINYTKTKLFGYVEVFNTVPQITTLDNLTAIEDKYYETIYEYEDIDIVNVGQTCHWEFATNTSWLNLNNKTGQLYGTPGNDDIGTYWVDIAICDPFDLKRTNFTLTVLDVNDNPKIITENIEVTNEDDLYEVQYNASDIDSALEKQIWSLATNASNWINIDTSLGLLKGIPTNSDVGDYWINVTVNDSENGIDFTNFTFTVLNVNDNPIILTEDVLLVETGKEYKVDYNATDIDSPISKLNWSLKTNATWLTIDTDSGLLEGSPTWNDAVSDADEGITWHKFILIVYQGNLPPIILTEDIEIARINEPYEVEYNATDDKPSDWLKWSFKSNASWLSFYSVSGVLSGIPTENDGGHQYWVNISVIDGGSVWDYHNFTLSVLRESKVNNIPILIHLLLTPSEGNTKIEFVFSVDYIDSDNDPPENISVVIDGIAYDMTLKSGESPFNGKYEYKTKLGKGSHSYYFTASDGKDIITSRTLIGPIVDHAEKVDETDWYNSIFVIITTPIILVIIITSLFIGGTEVGKYKFLSLCFVPLYNRLNRDKVYDNYTRGRIQGFIQAKPGEHYNAIKSALQLKNGTLTHHTKVLANEGLISIKRDGFFTRFYPEGGRVSEKNKVHLKEIQEELIDIIRHQPGITQHEINNYFEISQPSISYNLTQLTRNNLIKVEQAGRENKYYLNLESPGDSHNSDQYTNLSSDEDLELKKY